MRVVVQRCQSGSVSVAGDVIGQVSQGYVLLVGVTHEDTLDDVAYCARKIANLRVFEDGEGKMNLSIQDVGGAILSVSQFTLCGDTRKGNRPSFAQAAKPEQALNLYQALNQQLRDVGLAVQTGQFGANMQVTIQNDGPVTIIIDSMSR